MSKQIFVIIERPYYECLEPIEFAMAMAAFDHNVTLLLSGLAVELLSKDIPLLPFTNKDLGKLMASLPLYDIRVLPCEDDEALSSYLASQNSSDEAPLVFNF